MLASSTAAAETSIDTGPTVSAVARLFALSRQVDEGRQRISETVTRSPAFWVLLEERGDCGGKIYGNIHPDASPDQLFLVEAITSSSFYAGTPDSAFLEIPGSRKVQEPETFADEDHRIQVTETRQAIVRLEEQWAAVREQYREHFSILSPVSSPPSPYPSCSPSPYPEK